VGELRIWTEAIKIRIVLLKPKNQLRQGHIIQAENKESLDCHERPNLFYFAVKLFT